MAVVLVVTLAAAAYGAKKPSQQPCAGGRFLVRDARLIDAGIAPVEAIILTGRRIAINTGCPTARARVKGRNGSAHVRAHWRVCSHLVGPATLTADVESPGCTVMQGVFAVRKAHVSVAFMATRSVCGDGVFDQTNGERCDGANGCPSNQQCTAACTCQPGAVAPVTSTTAPTHAPVCGDGRREGAEQCDPPGAAVCPAPLGGVRLCDSDCRCPAFMSTTTTTPPPRCGDGVVEAGEVCDPPFAQGACTAGEKCSADCQSCVSVCGDGVVATSEFCDPPGDAAGCPVGEVCDGTCQRCTACGNGTLDPGEACDTPFRQGICPAGETCSSDCLSCAPTCGDGQIVAPEVCDPPGVQGGCPTGEICGDACRSCSSTAGAAGR